MNNLNVYDLKCEYKKNPIGIDIKKPRFFWKLKSDKRNLKQISYQIQVAEEDKTFENLVWDSGEVKSSKSTQIEYQGDKLKPKTCYYYRIRVETNQGESDWTESHFFEMGLLKASDWEAEWITPAYDFDPKKYEAVSLLRREFKVDDKIKKARAYVTGLGLYRFYLNGKKVGNDHLRPGWTSYNKRTQYQVYDLKDYLQNGNNALGIMLADGWYMGDLMWEDSRNFYGKDRLALVQIEIEYQSGKKTIISNKDWKSTESQILMSEIYHGEKYDARLEKKGWNQPDYNDSDWSGVKKINKSKEILVAQENTAVKKMMEIKPEKLITTPKGEKVIDFGQNMVGWVKFKVKGEAGDKVVLKHAEVLDQEGNFYLENIRKADQKIEYILKGDGVEEYEPYFTFQGFRYVKVADYPGRIDLDDFTGVVIYSDMDQTIDFECSNEMLNKLHDNIIWGQRGNFVDIPTDCPQRDERLGWTGDAQVFIKASAYNMDVASFFTKWLHDLKSDQEKDGAVPFVVPDPRIDSAMGNSQHAKEDKMTASAAWGDAAAICPWTIFEIYGDRRLLKEQYQSIKDWVEYIREQGENEYLWNTGFHFGDWLALDAPENSYTGLTAKEYIATAFFAHSTRILRDTADILDKENDYKKYTKLLENIKESFNQEFVTPKGRVSESTQTAYVLALYFDLLKEEHRKKATSILADYVADRDGHLTTGFVGTPYLNHVLSNNGNLDLAYQLLEREEYPSWIYPITKGATTIWEHWDGIKEDGSFWPDDMNSYNHYAYGAIADWIYQVVSGIKTKEYKAFKEIIIKPRPGGSLDYARTVFDSIHGQIKSSWEIDADNYFNLDVDIPANTEAEIILEKAKMTEVKENGQKLSKEVEGIKEIIETKNELKVKVNSGKFNFRYKL